MKKVIILVFVFCCFTGKSQFSNSRNPFDVNSFVPQTPQTASLGDYSKMPGSGVSNSNQGYNYSNTIPGTNTANSTSIQAEYYEHLTKQKQLLEEAYNEFPDRADINIDNTGYTTNQLDSITNDFNAAFNKINNMLLGKEKLSMINASYDMEAVFGNPYLTKQEYQENFKRSANFIKTWLNQNNIAITPHNLHYGLQAFMKDTISITTILPDAKKSKKTITHYPYLYDYADYDGKIDDRNYFATKCAATGTGQCNSLPQIYVGICEQLGIKANIVFAPFHSFVKFTDETGKVFNFEPTSNWSLSDKWYQEHFYVSRLAKENGIYLEPYSTKQTVANYLVDLSILYMRKTANYDTNFVNKCLNTAALYFPKNNNVHLHLAKTSFYGTQMKKKFRTYKITDVNSIANYPDLLELNNKMSENERLLASLGFADIPKVAYEQMLVNQKNKTNSPDAKKKKSLFKTKVN